MHIKNNEFLVLKILDFAVDDYVDILQSILFQVCC